MTDIVDWLRTIAKMPSVGSQGLSDRLRDAAITIELLRQDIERIERRVGEPQPPVQGPSVRVRIAVAVNIRGGWDCYAAGGYGDQSAAERACEYLDGPTRLSFVEANVPLPVPQAESVIEGEVTP